MKKILLVLSACAIAAPAQALSIVSLHSPGAAPVMFTAVETAIAVASVLALSGVVAFRLVKR